MDIKLKNKYDTKYLVIAGSILLCALIMLGLYPYFAKKAEAGSIEYYENADSQFLNTLSESNYILYRELRNQKTNLQLSPAELFLPDIAGVSNIGNFKISMTGVQSGMESFDEGLEDMDDVVVAAQEKTDSFDADVIPDMEITLDDSLSPQGNALKNRFLEVYKIWEENWNYLRKNIDYQVIDEENYQVVLGNIKEEMDAADYAVFIKMNYDDKGNAIIASANGVGDSAQIKSILQEFLYVNPLEPYYTDDMRYDYRYAFSRPVNCTFVYGLTAMQLESFVNENHYNNYGGDLLYYSTGDVMKMVTALSVCLFLLAFLIPIADRSVNGKEWYSRGFLEAAVIIGGTLITPVHVRMVADVNQGIWLQNLKEAGFMPVLAKMLIFMGGLIWWLVVFSLIFWASSCILAIRTMGPGNYLRERCLTYRAIRYTVKTGKSAIERVYRMIVQADRNDESRKTVFKLVLINFLVLAAICSAWFFGYTLLVIYSIILYVILVKYFKDRKYQYRMLLKATNAIAQGNLDVEIKEDLGMFEPFKKEIQKIQQGFKKAVDEEVKSQRMKTDLISNVSHDLKTPLTAIITYVNLLKNDTITQEQRKDYINVLDSKSMRLKVLIEDIFEISKATSQNVTLNLMEIDIVNLLKQVRLELDDKIEESQLDFRWKLPDHKIVLMLDSQKTFRIFENLLMNILKYSLPGTRVYIDMGIQEDEVLISMKNVSAVELEGDPNDMTERFARGDQARNTEGSGLGLAIVKSFVELQKGKLELETEADLFKVTIRWKAVEFFSENEYTNHRT